LNIELIMISNSFFDSIFSVVVHPQISDGAIGLGSLHRKVMAHVKHQICMLMVDCMGESSSMPCHDGPCDDCTELKGIEIMAGASFCAVQMLRVAVRDDLELKPIAPPKLPDAAMIYAEVSNFTTDKPRPAEINADELIARLIRICKGQVRP
jgi:hypothetical protein